ncbi:MAG: NAD(P)H-dependent oxidoreductase [Flavobacteriales bacterium]|nr:NAD(P)H-dependent oxidoreductase [Flavobacteriales bacterium]MCB9448080.1 NAD(P)H-dependent oxidoreductase [Flavobacteriales bacterium]
MRSGKNILAFAGSTSSQSINKQLVTYAAGLIRNARVHITDLNDYPLPLFSVDLEKEGYPEHAIRFAELMNSNDAYLISLAEHNGSYTAAFKNLFDWVSRIEPKVFGEKPVLLLSTSPGARGGAGVMEAARSRFPRHGGRIIGHFSLPSFNENFNPVNGLSDPYRAELEKVVGVFDEEMALPLA